MTTSTPYVVVTPVRDEAGYIRRTLNSMVRQTILPVRWVIVDDGSTDGTGEILDRFASRHPWIRIVHRPNRGFRAAGGGVVEAFYAGFEQIDDVDWQFVVKLDGDLSFEPDYFERCIAHFDADPHLGLAGGLVCSESDGGFRVDSAGDPPFHVRGATKIYRLECWRQIAPLARAPGWDTLDEVCANFHGWRTRTFPELRLVQHKPTGSADGQWANAVKNGKANYLTGYHPAFMLAKCIKRLFRPPYIVGAAGLCAGFMSCYFRRAPQFAQAEVIRYLRRQQVRRLFSMSSIYG